MQGRTVRVGVVSFVVLAGLSMLFVPPGRAEAAALQGQGIVTSSGPTSAPAAPAWMAQPTDRWPQMLLMPDIIFKNRSRLTGAAGFLVQMPNGAIVAATMKHTACLNDTVDAFEKSFTSFLMHPKMLPGRAVTLRKAAIKPEDADRLDCLLMLVPPQALPVEVRPARTTPPVAGETVYLLGVPDNEHSSQNVYKGKVFQCTSDDDFAYDVGPMPDTVGFAGAPVLDADGNVLGIHMGMTELHQGPPFRRALRMSSVVAACTAQATSRPAAKIASSQPAKSPTSAPAAAATRPRMIAIPADPVGRP